MLLNCGAGKTLESPLDSKESKPVNPNGNQSWTFIGRTGAEAEAPILQPPDSKSQLIGKDPGTGKDWGQGEKGRDRGWDGWMASLTQWTWVWANSGRQWRLGKPDVLPFMGSQRIRHNLVTGKHQIASQGQRPEMQLNILQCMGRLPQEESSRLKSQ